MDPIVEEESLSSGLAKENTPLIDQAGKNEIEDISNNYLEVEQISIAKTSISENIEGFVKCSMTDNILCQNYSSKPSSEFKEDCKLNLSLLHVINKDQSLKCKFEKRLKEKILNRGADLSSDTIMLYLNEKLCSKATLENAHKVDSVEKNIQKWIIEVIFDLKNEIDNSDADNSANLLTNKFSNILNVVNLQNNKSNNFLWHISEKGNEGELNHNFFQKPGTNVRTGIFSDTKLILENNDNFENKSWDRRSNMHFLDNVYDSDSVQYFTEAQIFPREKFPDSSQLKHTSNESFNMPHNTDLTSTIAGHEQTEDIVTVKFMTKEQFPLFTNAYKMSCCMFDAKESLSQVLSIHRDHISLLFDGVELADELTLAELNVQPHGTVELTLQTPELSSLQQWNIYREFSVPDVITVRLGTNGDSEASAVKDVIVEIEKARVKKEFLGGFRDKRTGVEYHNACSQTNPSFLLRPLKDKVSRRIQTVQESIKFLNTSVTRGVQVYVEGRVVPDVGDKYVSSSSEKDTEMKNNINNDIVNMVIVIQRYVRGWMARNLVKKMKMHKNQIVASFRGDLNMNREIPTAIAQKACSKTFRPVTKTDFEIIYALIERWRRAEIGRISEVNSKISQKALFCSLLEKEIEMLSQIEKQRCRIREEERRKKNQMILQNASQPITWRSYKGINVSMETIRVQRAKELRHLYNAIFQKSLSVEDRLELLISLKYALKKHNYSMVSELTRLIDRECEFIVRGLGKHQLEMLRERIRLLFIAFIKEVYCNSNETGNSLHVRLENV